MFAQILVAAKVHPWPIGTATSALKYMSVVSALAYINALIHVFSRWQIIVNL